MRPVNLFEQVAQFDGNMDVHQLFFEQCNQVAVVFGGNLFFQYFVPGLLRIGVSTDLEAFLPIGQNVGVLQHVEILFRRIHEKGEDGFQKGVDPARASHRRWPIFAGSKT